MKTHWGFLFAVAALELPLDLPVKIDLVERVLDNGMRVLILPDPHSKLVSYQTWVRAGSVDEERGKTGLAHLFEHLMFKGTEKIGPRKFFELLESRGAEVNAYTTRDYTVFYETLHPDWLDSAIEMESDRLQGLKLSEALLNSERMVVFEERRLRMENAPDGRIEEALWQLAYPEHPYGRPIIGTPQDLARLTLEDAQNFFKTYYQPSHVSLLISGNVNPETLFEKIKKAYGGIPSQPRKERPEFPRYNQNSERRVVLTDDVASPRLSYGYRITPAEHADTSALDVLAQILFQGDSSRAQAKLVRGGVFVALSGMAFTPTYPGLFLMTGVLRQGVTLEKAEQALEGLIQEVQKKGVTEAEVQSGVRQLTVQYLDSMQSPRGLAQLVGSVELVLGKPSKFIDELNRLRSVKAADVQRVAQQYLDPNKRSVVVLARKGTKS